ETQQVQNHGHNDPRRDGHQHRKQELVTPSMLGRWLRPDAVRSLLARPARAAFGQATEKECQARDECGHNGGNEENELDGHRKPRFSPAERQAELPRSVPVSGEPPETDVAAPLSCSGSYATMPPCRSEARRPEQPHAADEALTSGTRSRPGRRRP